MCVCVFSKIYNSFFLPQHIERKTRKNHLFCAVHCGSDPNPEVGCVLFICVGLHWSIGFSCPIIPSYIKTLTIPSTALHTFQISILKTGLLSKLLPILICLKFFIFPWYYLTLYCTGQFWWFKLLKPGICVFRTLSLKIYLLSLNRNTVHIEPNTIF